MADSNRRFSIKGLVGIRPGFATIAGVLTTVVLAITLLASLGGFARDAQAQSAGAVNPPPQAVRLPFILQSQQRPAARPAAHPVVSQTTGLPPLITSGTWVPLNHQPSFSPESIFVLTDGRILAQDGKRTDVAWWTLTPDNTGSYINGQWTQVNSPSNCPNGYPGQSSSTVYSPLYYASAVLADGRVVVIGGEYNYNYNYATAYNGGKSGSSTWTDQGAIYDPVANNWTCITPPSTWPQIGDAESVVLDDGTFMTTNTGTQVATLDTTASPPTFNTPFTPPGKQSVDDSYDEEGWNLLPDGTVLTLEIYNINDGSETPALAYNPVTMAWDPAGIAMDPLVFTSISEIGPAVLRPDGTLFAEGATGFNAVYDTITADWSNAPTFPTITESYSSGSGSTMCTLTDVTEQFAAVDAPAVLLPDGNVLAAVSPYDTTPNCGWITPTEFFEFDGTNLTKVNAPPNAPNDVSFNGRLLDLPNGQIMWTDGTTDVEIYEPMGTYDSSWAPTITASPIQVLPGGTNYQVTGTQFNGLSQAVGYGDDYQAATNYPLVRIKNNSSGHVIYARTHDHSTMGVATGTTLVSTEFDVPSATQTGASTLVVVANGIPSQPVNVIVGPPANDLVVEPGSDKVQLVHSTSPMSDELNMDFTFVDKGPPFPACGPGTDALNFLEVELEEGTCASLPGAGEAVGLNFVSHTVGDETYGTDYYAAPGEGGGTVSARIVMLPTPAGTCGEWTLNLEVDDLDLDFDSLSGGNPFALLLEDGNGNTGCFDVTNAIVGTSIDPPGKGTRRVRRDTRR